MIRSTHVFLDLPADEMALARRFWSAVLQAEVGEPWPDHPEFVSLEPPDGATPHLHLQAIEGAARVHLDLGVDSVAAEAERLLALGATEPREFPDWLSMRSPGGLPFCLVQARPERAETAVRWPDGHRTRLVQVCIDSPAALHDAEADFWRRATGWPFETSQHAEFAGKLWPGLPTAHQLLLQRLGEDDAAQQTRAHLDLGATDLAAEADRVERLGARRLREIRGWIAFEDPLGHPFCVTQNSPD